MNRVLIAALLATAALQASAQPAPPCPPHICGRSANYATKAEPMAVLVNAAPGVVVYLESINASSSPAYLKIFDSVQVPSCAGQPAAIIPILAAAGGAPAWAKRQTSIDLKAGVAFCIVGAVDDGDVSAPPPGVVINLRYK